MSEPKRRNKDRLQGAILEIFAAQTALRMPPRPRKPTSTEDEYLCELDHWAHHSMEHLDAALTYLQRMASEQLLMELRHWEGAVEDAERKNRNTASASGDSATSD